LPGYEVVTWFGILTTAGTPGEVVTRLYNEIAQMIQVPAVKEHIVKLGLEIVGSSPRNMPPSSRKRTSSGEDGESAQPARRVIATVTRKR
jgi:tripartite-type tricarboxylate transporter receptor subunit TctC